MYSSRNEHDTLFFPELEPVGSWKDIYTDCECNCDNMTGMYACIIDRSIVPQLHLIFRGIFFFAATNLAKSSFALIYKWVCIDF